ncbi:sulfatase-like hydrolase/transferase [Sphingomonas sp.]|uniref:sulfatase-like hydrolase/transferase n=1 Tax=Sphingomonas sp. TaxID=28214 RepID=UPI002CF5157F|nr:sulfatase-like hydrolase/transferase [Sphingomonas sp.]HTG37863.1 sulfatase-like hydrolase/transferase [Sphingomonas sp.]
MSYSRARQIVAPLLLSATAAIATPLVGAPTALPDEQTPARPPAAAPQPNILFILVDDMGYGDLSLTGNKRVSTPNIDALARDGLVMTQFYDAAPICSPSRAGVFTGQFPARNRFTTYISDRARNARFGQTDWLDPRLPNMARSLKGAGYATGHFGKWHMGGGRDVGDAPLPSAYGFDESYTQFEGLGPRLLPSDLPSNLAKQSAALGKGPVDWAPRAQVTGRYVDRLLDFVGREKAGPWFAQLWLDDVHTPWVPDGEQVEHVKGEGRSQREDKFFAVLVAMDAEIGRLVDALRRAGELDDTLIVFTSDNGPTVGANTPGSAGPFRGRKASLYEGGMRQPLIVRWPGHVKAGSRDARSVVQAVDLLPTLTHIAGAKMPAGADGIDIGGTWAGRPLTKRPDLFFHIARPATESAFGPLYAVRSGPWKLLMNANRSNVELYNIDEDPAETRDRKTDVPDVARRLTDRVAGWIAKLPPPGPATRAASGE